MEGVILYKEVKEGISDNMTLDMRLNEDERLAVMCSKQRDNNQVRDLK